MTDKYDSIINLPHHVSKTRTQMPMSDRAAQFSPFAALVGFDESIENEERNAAEKDSHANPTDIEHNMDL